MKKRRLIAVITGVCCNDYQQSIINGITQQCRNLNCDTAVFNFFSNFDEDNPHQNAENNIFKLINYRLFDGVIFDSQLILKSSTRRSIENDIIASGIPAMQIYFSENDRLQGVPVNDAAAFEQITDHIIDVHGCSRLFCLTAYQNEYCSEQRLQGFINSLKKHGITPDSSMWRYGDYWKIPATKLGADIAGGTVFPRPQAVVCANDVSAESLISSLLEHGIRVPEDIIVTGHDDSADAKLNVPSITSYRRANEKLGAQTVCKLFQKITGSETIIQPALFDNGHIVTGRSCGCNEAAESVVTLHKQISSQKMYDSLIRSSNMLANLTLSSTVDKLMDCADRYTYLLGGMEELFICLCDDWDYCSDVDDDQYRTTGFSDNMQIKLHKTTYERKPSGKIFKSSELLPALTQPHDSPKTFFFNSLHHNGRIFGYSAISYCDGKCLLSDLYAEWISYLETGIEYVRIQNYLKSTANKAFLAQMRDALTGIYNANGFDALFHKKFDTASAENRKLFLFIAQVDGIRRINDTFGHLEGDSIRSVVASALQGSFYGDEICARISDATFAAVGMCDYDDGHLSESVGRFEKYINQYNCTSFKPYKIQVSIGSICSYISHDMTPDIFFAMTENEVENYRNKASGNSNDIPHYDKLIAIREKIYHQPGEKWTVDNLTGGIYISKGYFQRIYCKCFGVSLTNDIINSKISFAKRLLSGTDERINEIAEKCGYESYEYFLHQFKHETGITPSEYRKNGL